jgi:peptide/nickel transport system substrate-binding protein
MMRLSGLSAAVARRGVGRVVGLGVIAGLLLLGLGSATQAAQASTGGTVTYAEQPGAAPTYIFPLQGPDYFNYQDIGQFSNLLYLPLYSFGSSGEPVLNKSLSLASAPVLSDNNTVATITLKHWVWSNGQPVDAADVIFWMNLLSAATDPNAPVVSSSSSAPGPAYGGAVPGGFPENVVSYQATGTYTVVFKMNASYNATWLLFNEFSQITPIPQASWDELSAAGPIGDYDASAQVRTALPGAAPVSYVPSNPGTASSGALGVAQFLNVQSQTLSTYTTNPLWKVVDGPFRLTGYTTDGFVKMVPNASYSGSPKPSIAAFEELPFTSEAAEFDALRSGSLTIGYLPPEDTSQKASLERSDHYSYSPWNIAGINYIAYNFTNPKTGPVLSQLYFRQALQYLIDQPQYIKRFLGGVGNVENGPVPAYPTNSPYLSPLLAHGQVYPFDPAKAVTLLKAHGWKVKPGGASVCSKPGSGSGECGAGVKGGQQASFSLLYGSGSAALTGIVDTMQSTMKLKAGIDLNVRAVPLSQVSAVTYNGCSPSTPCTNWDLTIASTYASWTFEPDYLPTGEEPFETGSGSNLSDYSNQTNDANILATNTAATETAEIHALFTYENYLARQLPRGWMPDIPAQLTLYKSDLKGLAPQNPFQQLNPQYYVLKG